MVEKWSTKKKMISNELVKLHSLWRIANARNVGFIIFYCGNFYQLVHSYWTPLTMTRLIPAFQVVDLVCQPISQLVNSAIILKTNEFMMVISVFCHACVTDLFFSVL